MGLRSSNRGINLFKAFASQPGVTYGHVLGGQIRQFDLERDMTPPLMERQRLARSFLSGHATLHQKALSVGQQSGQS